MRQLISGSGCGGEVMGSSSIPFVAVRNGIDHSRLGETSSATPIETSLHQSTRVEATDNDTNYTARVARESAESSMELVTDDADVAGDGGIYL